VSTFFDPDPLLRRLERHALVFCAVAAGAAWAVRGGNPDIALGIAGGGVLSVVSYWTIRSSVTRLTRLVGTSPGSTDEQAAGPAAAGPTPEAPPATDAAAAVFRPGIAAVLVQLTGRYALLALIAYGMIARLTLHPVGLLIGISSVVVAASLEAVRVVAGQDRRP
jgi:hypothetical protein